MQEFNPILGPAALLATWSVIMVFIYVIRVMGSGAKLGELPPGFRGPDGEADAPDKMKWTRHNYEHLMEQPTAFYALVIILAMVGDTSTPSLYAAWTYPPLPRRNIIINTIAEGHFATIAKKEG